MSERPAHTTLPDHLHRVGSRLRRSPLLRNQRWLWNAAEPAWNALVRRASRRRGVRFEINGDALRLDYAYGARYERTGYEPLVHRYFVAGVQPGMVVFDVGAHVGVFALAAAFRVGSQGRVVAFEPSPATAEILRRHCAMNGADDRIEVVEAIVSDRAGVSSLFAYEDSMAASLSREHMQASPERFTHPPVRVEVPSITLDAFCELRRIAPDRVKIGVEGAEILVLRGATSVLASAAGVICEVHPTAIRRLGGALDDLESLAHANGRSVQILDEPNEQGIYHVRLARTAAETDTPPELWPRADHLAAGG